MVTYTAATRRTQEGIACPPRGAIILVFHYLPSSASLHSPSPVFQEAFILPFLIPVIYLNLLHSLEVHLVTPEGQRCNIGPLSTGTHTPTMLEQPSLPVFLVLQISRFIFAEDAKRMRRMLQQRGEINIPQEAKCSACSCV